MESKALNRVDVEPMEPEQMAPVRPAPREGRRTPQQPQEQPPRPQPQPEPEQRRYGRGQGFGGGFLTVDIDLGFGSQCRLDYIRHESTWP